MKKTLIGVLVLGSLSSFASKQESEVIEVITDTSRIVSVISGQEPDSNLVDPGCISKKVMENYRFRANTAVGRVIESLVFSKKVNSESQTSYKNLSINYVGIDSRIWIFCKFKSVH